MPRDFSEAWKVAKHVHRVGSLRETFYAVLRLQPRTYRRLVREASVGEVSVKTTKPPKRTQEMRQVIGGEMVIRRVPIHRPRSRR